MGFMDGGVGTAAAAAPPPYDVWAYWGGTRIRPAGAWTDESDTTAVDRAGESACGNNEELGELGTETLGLFNLRKCGYISAKHEHATRA